MALRSAALALADHIGQQTVTCERHDVDRYGRIVAVCRAGGGDLNAWMVSQGCALAYRHYSIALCQRGGRSARRAPRHLARHVHGAVGLAAWVAHAIRCDNDRASGSERAGGGRLLQGLLVEPGLRRRVYQQDEDLPQAAGVRVRSAVGDWEYK